MQLVDQSRNTARAPLHFHEEGQSEDAIILLPGLHADRRTWRLVQRRLAARYRTIAVDNRGCGLSPFCGESLTLSGMAQDTVELMNTLDLPRCFVIGIYTSPFSRSVRLLLPQAGEGWDEGDCDPRCHTLAIYDCEHPHPAPCMLVCCFVVGHSMGGAIGQMITHLFPDRMRGLVLCNTFRYGAGPRLQSLMEILQAQPQEMESSSRQGYVTQIPASTCTAGRSIDICGGARHRAGFSRSCYSSRLLLI